jgi:hypothetical protein
MNDTHGNPPHRTERKKAMARHEREAKVYFAVDGEEGYLLCWFNRMAKGTSA